MSFASIKKAVDWFCGVEYRLDILVNNAGIMATPPETTKEGMSYHSVQLNAMPLVQTI
jgi:NAD(P)-dependent dehydrogenase (short-subunit alcohol dehydrogenase family)